MSQFYTFPLTCFNMYHIGAYPYKEEAYWLCIVITICILFWAKVAEAVSDLSCL
jgi:hypothetical protein